MRVTNSASAGVWARLWLAVLCFCARMVCSFRPAYSPPAATLGMAHPTMT
eukprot:CAMPEP_0173370654 /NCGR_PEP_ID=MMETSP1144-20121109/26825_1 /TAXON_ID=483371 /ORGANISM="non described non described, Strain CCMP2298" /LENGTH=49 /DNA_ID= /DNA_START= /DNA_END= /DNA_ORIENTATION=